VDAAGFGEKKVRLETVAPDYTYIGRLKRLRMGCKHRLFVPLLGRGRRGIFVERFREILAVHIPNRYHMNEGVPNKLE
jgi:hypothetical protein